MKRSTFFHLLGAPMVNDRWSWGARAHDGTIYLCIWKDRIEQRADGRWALALNTGGNRNSNGWHERVRHVGMISAGAPAMGIYCVSKTSSARPRKMTTFNDEYLLQLGELQSDVPLDGSCDVWIRITDVVSIEKHLRQRNNRNRPGRAMAVATSVGKFP